MSIIFHCNHCGKKIETVDSSGGKWGKCPACHNKVYVPDLNIGEEDELKLAPLDVEEERHKKELMAETFKIEQAILAEREEADGKEKRNTEKPRPAEISEKDLTDRIISYLRLMADGQIGDAERILKGLKNYSRGAVVILDRIAMSDIPEPELSDIPGQVLSGFIRNLRKQISW